MQEKENYAKEKKETMEGGEENLLTPKNDIIFQSLFSKGHERITKALISSIIKTEVTEIDMDSSTHLNRKYMDSKLGILDFRAKLQDGIQCNIEIQLKDKGDTEDRFVWYTSNQYVSQLKKGEPYGELKKTICILILDYELPLLEDIEEGYTNWKWREEKHPEKVLTEKVEIYIISLPKIIRKKNKEENNSLIQWMLFLSDPKSKEVQKIMKENEEIKEAVDIFEDITSDEELRRIMEVRDKAIRDEKNMIRTAEKKAK